MFKRFAKTRSGLRQCYAVMRDFELAPMFVSQQERAESLGRTNGLSAHRTLNLSSNTDRERTPTQSQLSRSSDRERTTTIAPLQAGSDHSSLTVLMCVCVCVCLCACVRVRVCARVCPFRAGYVALCVAQGGALCSGQHAAGCAGGTRLRRDDCNDQEAQGCGAAARTLAEPGDALSAHARCDRRARFRGYFRGSLSFSCSVSLSLSLVSLLTPPLVCAACAFRW
jgi:hypothetical protein